MRGFSTEKTVDINQFYFEYNMANMITFKHLSLPFFILHCVTLSLKLFHKAIGISWTMSGTAMPLLSEYFLCFILPLFN